MMAIPNATRITAPDIVMGSVQRRQSRHAQRPPKLEYSRGGPRVGGQAELVNDTRGTVYIYIAAFVTGSETSRSGLDRIPDSVYAVEILWEPTSLLEEASKRLISWKHDDMIVRFVSRASRLSSLRCHRSKQQYVTSTTQPLW